MERTKITKDSLINAHWFCAAVGDNGPATPKTFYNRYEKWKKEKDPVCDALSHPLFYDRVTKMWTQDGKPMTYIDELR